MLGKSLKLYTKGGGRMAYNEEYEKVKPQYLTGKATLTTLAKEFNLSYKGLREYAYREKWLKDRKKAEEAARRKVIKKAAKELETKQDEFSSAVGKILAKVKKMIDDETYEMTPQNLYTLAGVLVRLKECRDTNNHEVKQVNVILGEEFEGLCE